MSRGPINIKVKILALEPELKENVTCITSCNCSTKGSLFAGPLVYVDMKRTWFCVARSQISHHRYGQTMLLYLILVLGWDVSLRQYK